MARPREFNMENTLQGAMNVFWTYGYDSASLPRLLEGMGLTRGSFYKAFIDKKSLFMQVLDRYAQEAVCPAVAILENPDVANGLDRIEQLFKLVTKSVREGNDNGCLLCSAAAGPASQDKEIAQAVHKLLDEMQAGFETAITHSKTHAKLDQQAQKNLAKLMVTQYVGLQILIRSRAPLETLEESIACSMQLLAIQD